MKFEIFKFSFIEIGEKQPQVIVTEALTHAMGSQISEISG